MSRTLATSICIISLLAAAGALLAGPLAPPPGQIASTYKTLNEVEPRIAINAANTPGNAGNVYRITQSGSYYLTGDMSVGALQTGIQVATGYVSIDLNGFTIYGGQHAIVGASGVERIEIHNGAARGSSGVALSLVGTYHAKVEHVFISAAGGTGLATQDYGIVRDVRCDGCAGGLDLGISSTAQSCVVVLGAASPAPAIRVDSECRVSDCICYRNPADGFRALGPGSVFTGCTATYNTGSGFVLDEGNVVEHCMADSNQSEGIMGANNTSVVACTAQHNWLRGIRVGSYCKVNACRAYQNGVSGFAGIWLEGLGCRVEENECIGNGFGIFTTATDNIIARNSARSSSITNYSIVAGNELAPVITNPGSNNFATMTPWSNISY